MSSATLLMDLLLLTSASLALTEALLSRVVRITSQQIPAQHGRAPVLLDVPNHQFRALVMAHKRRLLRVVHRIGQIADEHAAYAPAGHLPNGERPSQHAHVRMHPHDY